MLGGTVKGSHHHCHRPSTGVFVIPSGPFCKGKEVSLGAFFCGVGENINTGHSGSMPTLCCMSGPYCAMY